MWIFVSCEAWFSSFYLWPISWTAASLIDLFGVSVLVYDPPDQESLCILEIGRFVFHVENQCSGISAFFIYLAALIAYPAKSGHKVRGALIGIPAFFAYGALRLVVLGAIAITIPDLLRFFHALVLMVWVGGRGSLLRSTAEQENPQATTLESTPVLVESQDGYRHKTRSKTKKTKSKRRRHHPQKAPGATLQPMLS